MKSYEQQFEFRGSAYSRAMTRVPYARREEFQQLLNAAEIVAGMIIFDVPAGDGHLKIHLPAGCDWLGHEPCASFLDNNTTSMLDLLPFPLSDRLADRVISLAGLHHVQDKAFFFSEARRVARETGKLIISDVVAGSTVAKFLDDFVGQYNGVGHKGYYLDDLIEKVLYKSGWQVEAKHVNSFHWVFNDAMEMVTFCRELFDLRGVGDVDILEAINGFLGWSERQDGMIGMNWNLQTVVSRKTTASG